MLLFRFSKIDPRIWGRLPSGCAFTSLSVNGHCPFITEYFYYANYLCVVIYPIHETSKLNWSELKRPGLTFIHDNCLSHNSIGENFLSYNFRHGVYGKMSIIQFTKLYDKQFIRCCRNSFQSENQIFREKFFLKFLITTPFLLSNEQIIVFFSKT